MAGFQADLQHLPGQPIACLDRLVWVGVGPHRDRRGLVTALAQLGAKQRGRIRLGKQLGLEIQPGREIVERVAGPRIAIDAAMLAAAIGIDRAVKRDVRRSVAADDPPGPFLGHRGPQFRARPVNFRAGVKPVSVCLTRCQPEALGYRRRLCAAAMDGGGTRHPFNRTYKEHLSKRCAWPLTGAGRAARG